MPGDSSGILGMAPMGVEVPKNSLSAASPALFMECSYLTLNSSLTWPGPWAPTSRLGSWLEPSI